MSQFLEELFSPQYTIAADCPVSRWAAKRAITQPLHELCNVYHWLLLNCYADSAVVCCSVPHAARLLLYLLLYLESNSECGYNQS